MEVDPEEIVNFASSDDSSDYDDDYRGLRNPMLELFGVKINCIGDLYGTITAGSLNDPQKLFDRESTNSQSISMGGDDNIILLTGPLIAIWHLIKSSSTWISRTGTHPNQRRIKSTGRLRNSGLLDNPSYMEIHGNNGKFVTVFYAVFSDTAKAALEVRLLPVDDENKGNKNQLRVVFYGLLAASNDRITGDDYESVLFRIKKDSGQIVEVRPGEAIPLSSPVVAVPLNSNLIVRADLFCLVKTAQSFVRNSPFVLNPLVHRRSI